MTRALFLALMLFGAPLRPEAQMLIEDFTGAPSEAWAFFTDQVMGGVSTGQAAIGGSPAHLHLTGQVSTANNGGFIQARRMVSVPADVTGFGITAKGDGQVYYLHVRTTRTALPWHYYQAPFTVPTDWAELRVSLDSFVPSGRGLPALQAADIRSIALVAYGRDHAADLRVARIEALN